MNPKVVQTIIEMLQDRGYNIEKGGLHIQGKKGDETLKIYHDDSSKIGIKEIKIILEDMETNQVNQGILVYSGSITHYAKQFLKDDVQGIQYFHEDELTFNITHHTFVPEHIKVSNEVKQTLLNKYKVGAKNLPWIFSTDPVVKYHGGKVGDVFKIIRDNSDGRSVNYRICI